MAKITFMGVGGGRFVILNQIRASGGMILEMDGEMLHIDPGPGALVRAKQYGVKLRKLTGILVSHVHPDHCTDTQVVIEAMTEGAKKKKGVLIGNEHVFRGEGDFITCVSPYHLSVLETYKALKPGEKIIIGGVEITATPTKHGEPKCIGFVFEGSRKIGYASDGEYFRGQEDYFRGCDCLILNVLRPRNVTWPGHMNSDQARGLIEKAKPKLAAMQHFGMKMLRGVAERDAKWIQSKTGVRTIAARDGLVLELDAKQKKTEEKSLKKFWK